MATQSPGIVPGHPSVTLSHHQFIPPHPPLQSSTVQVRKDQPSSVSFAAVAARPRLQPRFPAIAITSKNLGVKDGKPSVSFSNTEFQAGAKRFSHSLVAKFSVGRPPLREIQNEFQKAWQIEGRATISEVWDGRHILVILDSEKDVSAAMAAPLRRVGHAMFRLFRWNPEYDPRRESTRTTAWFRFPDLPLPLYDVGFIEVIASSFGTFLDVDEKTKACTSLKFARVCIEIDVSKAIPDEVWVNLPNEKGYWQKIVVESKLSYCQRCKIHGHDVLQCRKSFKRQQTMALKESSREVPKKISNSKQIKLPDHEVPMLDVMQREVNPHIQQVLPSMVCYEQAPNNVTPACGQDGNRVGKRRAARAVIHVPAEEGCSKDNAVTEINLCIANQETEHGWTVVERRKAIRKVNSILARRGGSAHNSITAKDHDQLLALYKPKQLPVSIPLAPDDDEDEDSEGAQDQQDILCGFINRVEEPHKTEKKIQESILHLVSFETPNPHPPQQ